MAFVRSGDINLEGGKLYNFGLTRYNWSETVLSDTRTYTLYVDTATVYTSHSNVRHHAFPLRCLYLGSV